MSQHSSQNQPNEFSTDSRPLLRGIVACCTSIPIDQRTEIHNKITDMGGIHIFDLTADVTHLLVGDYDTPKYRYVAQQRSDIKAMDAAWIDKIAHLWKLDEEVDLESLEAEYMLRPLDKCGRRQPRAVTGEPSPQDDSLLLCLTGFGEQREQIAERIQANGARYTGDLTRKCSHLIVSAPEGKKFDAAKAWGVRTVTLSWLDRSIERGMILDEAKFDPLLPPEKQGVNAWIKQKPSASKRARSAGLTATDNGARKLRKTASMKLSSQQNMLWDEILCRPDSKQSGQMETTETIVADSKTAPSTQTAKPQDIFANCIFYIHGFRHNRTNVLSEAITFRKGTVAASLQAAANSPTAEPCWRFLIVPQDSQPDTHPQSQQNTLHVVTEFYIERCLYHQQFLHPDDHTLGRPFPLFPIPGFNSLIICSSGFTGLELYQVSKCVKQLGATYDEQFRKSTSVMVCRCIDSIRKDKLRYAVEWGVPIVPPDWLWECISTGFNVPAHDMIYTKVRHRYLVKKTSPTESSESSSDKAKGWKKTASRPLGVSGMDRSAFDSDSSETMRATRKGRSTTSADSATLAHSTEPTARRQGTHLSELSSASLNKSPSPTKAMGAQLSRLGTNSTGSGTNKKRHSKRMPSLPFELSSSDVPSDDNEPRKAEKKMDDDEAHLAVRAAERQRLTFKITSLLDKSKEQQAGNSTETAASSIGDLGPHHKPRRRRILGRAISNASNASSGPPESLRAASAMGDGEAGDGFEEGENREPPGTQLEYRDPKALERKAELMRGMMTEPGDSGGGSGGGDDGGGKEAPLRTAKIKGRTTRRRK